MPSSHHFILIALLAILVSGCIEDKFTLDRIQGAWFSDCNDPAVEFLIKGNKYSGDFYDSHELTLEGNVLTFKNGLVKGHSVKVSLEEKEFKILDLSKERMVLEHNLENGKRIKWSLYSCIGQ